MPIIAKRKNKKRGFSLIEVIVALGIFAIILTISLGALLTVVEANRQAKAIKLVVNNLNLSLENMSRELRVGSSYCDNASGSNCDNVIGSDEIFFTTDAGEADSRFRYDPVTQSIFRRIGTSGSDLRLTGSDVNVESLEFYIRGTGSGDTEQPTVLIIVNGSITQASQTVKFDIQTFVAQRKLAF